MFCRPVTLLKRDSSTCFSVIFAKFFRTAFFKERLRYIGIWRSCNFVCFSVYILREVKCKFIIIKKIKKKKKVPFLDNFTTQFTLLGSTINSLYYSYLEFDLKKIPNNVKDLSKFNQPIPAIRSSIICHAIVTYWLTYSV